MKIIEKILNQIYSSLCCFSLLLLIIFYGCNKKENKVIKTTLICIDDNDKLENSLDSIQIIYTYIDSITQNIKRVYFFRNINNDVSYQIKKNSDLLIVASPIVDTANIQEYINFDGKRLVIFPPISMKGSFRFDRIEYIKHNNKIDTLFVLVGNDIGTISKDSLCYFFDNDIHLHKISTVDNKVLFYDKEWGNVSD